MMLRAPSSTILPARCKGDAVVHLFLATLGDHAHRAACSTRAGARREADDVATSSGRDATAIEQVDIPGELLAGVFAGGTGLEGQQLVHLEQRHGLAGVEPIGAMSLGKIAVRLKERFEERLGTEARRPALNLSKML